MKKVVTVLPRDKYFSDVSGAGGVTLVQEKLMAMIGSADDIRVEVITYAISGATTRMAISLVEGTNIQMRPSMNMYTGALFATIPSTIPTPAPLIGVVETQVNGPFSGVMDIVLKVWDSASASQVWVEASVRLTLFYK